jgi:hypothetical protein
MEIGPELSPELNERATHLVVTAVARYPQSPYAMAVLADRLLDNFDPAPSSATGIGIAEMSRLVVEPLPTAKRINAVHDAFGIERRVSAAEAVGIVTSIAFGSLERLRMAAILSAAGRVALPEALHHRRLIVSGAQNDPSSRSYCWQEGADMLQEAYATHDVIRTEVIRQSKFQAWLLGGKSRAHQAEVVAGYHETRDTIADLRSRMC